MCGFVGFVGSYTQKKLSLANEILSHRGPDETGIWISESGGAGLAHKRLSIIDLSPSGSQPMSSQKGNEILVFNGEIYNFEELRANLQDKGVVFRGQSDTEVLLEMYLFFGEKMLTMLNGIFSFAIWDEKLKKLFIARDSFGVKPIYYSFIDGNLCFASEAKALFSLLNATKLDPCALSQYLSFLWSPGERTPLKEVKKLLPGEALIFRNGKIEKKWRWHNLPISKSKVKSSVSSSSRNLAKLLRNSVEKQMVSDVPLGAFLSGGLDSSSIVSFAKNVNPEIQCFTIDSFRNKEEGMINDLPYAKRVAKHLKVPLHVISVSSKDLASDIEKMISMLDEPLADPAALNVLYISRLARQNGIKVLLSGAGGDDIFTGYRRHFATQIDRYFQRIPLYLRNEIERLTNSLDSFNPFLRRLGKFFNGSTLDKNDRIINYFRWTDFNQVKSLFNQEFQKELNDYDPAESMLFLLDNLPNNLESLDMMLALEQRFFLPDHNLNYTDKMAMAAGVEVRTPFLENDLVEFASKLPLKYKQHRNEGKWILKKAMEPYLPRDIIYRSKTGFGAPLRSWVRNELKELIEDTLSEDSLKNRGVFDTKAVQQLITKNQKGEIDASYTIFSLMSIEIWCRNFIDCQFNYKEIYKGIK